MAECAACRQDIPSIDGSNIAVAHVHRGKPCLDRPRDPRSEPYTTAFVHELATKQRLTVPEWQRANLATMEL